MEIKFNFPNWEQAIKRAYPNMMRGLAAAIQTNRGMLFDQEGAYNGHDRWADLKFRAGQILAIRGTLRKSISPSNPKGLPGPQGIVRIAGNEITIGTTLGYATMMNWGTTKLPGGVLKPVRAKALKIPLPAGKRATQLAKTLRKKAYKGEKKNERFIFRKSVRIPARYFLEADDESKVWNQQDQEEFDATTITLLARAMNGEGNNV